MRVYQKYVNFYTIIGMKLKFYGCKFCAKKIEIFLKLRELNFIYCYYICKNSQSPMENAERNVSSSNNPNLTQGRSMDFSFEIKNPDPKVFRLVKEQNKVEQVCPSSTETREIQITLSPKQTQNHHFTGIKREMQQIGPNQFVLNSIRESVNQQTESNVHLFSNIRCSTSSQGEEQRPKQYSIQQIVAQKKASNSYQKQQNSTDERDKTTYRISTIIKDETTSKFVQLDFTEPNVYESDIIILRNYNEYKKEVMNIYRLSSIRIGEQQKIHLKSLKKLTVFPILMKKKQLQLQLIYSGGRIVFGALLKRHLYYLPEHYIWFAKIINAKLMNMGQKFGNSAEILIKHVNMGWNGNFSQGFVYKKSKYLRNWQKRYVVINTEGLFSYKQVNQNYTIFIPMQDIRVLSTEFDLFQKNLVIRIETEQQKIDFAIPVHDFCLKIENNWLFAFYRLLMEHKHHIKVS